MYKHILVPTDGSGLSEKAVRHGIALAKAVGAQLTVLTVTPPFHPVGIDTVLVGESPDEYEKRMRKLPRISCRQRPEMPGPPGSRAKPCTSKATIRIAPSSTPLRQEVATSW